MNTLLEAYIRATYGALRWLLIIILNVFGPVLRGLSTIISIFCVFAFFGYAITKSVVSLPALLMLGTAMFFTGIAVGYSWLTGWVECQGLEDDKEQLGALSWIFAWIIFAGMFAGLSWLSYRYLHLRNGFEGMAVGLALWLSIGLVCGGIRGISQFSSASSERSDGLGHGQVGEALRTASNTMREVSMKRKKTSGDFTPSNVVQFPNHPRND